MVHKIRCPKCNSNELTYNIGMKGGRMYLCKRCGYMGPLAIEWESEEEAVTGRWNQDADEHYPAPWYAKIIVLWYLWYVAALFVIAVIFLILWLAGL